jgi:hypothetical protein
MIETRPAIDRSSWLDAAVVMAGIEAVAIAIWLIPASEHIVGWTAGGAARVALFAPARTLMILAGSGLLIGGLFAVWSRARRFSRELAERVLPLNILWLWALPYVPFLPDRFPLLLVLAGPARWIVAAVVVAAVVLQQWESLESIAKGWARTGRSAVFAVSLAIYVAAGLYSAISIGPGGDEPHYLVITQSLIADHDLQIENNHTRGDYRPYFRGVLRPDFLVRGANNQIYSIHAPGLPALLISAFLAGGYYGAVVFICLIAALTALAVYDLALALA